MKNYKLLSSKNKKIPLVKLKKTATGYGAEKLYVNRLELTIIKHIVIHDLSPHLIYYEKL